jgi:LuxR family maltose regulon positive regulatory protein
MEALRESYPPLFRRHARRPRLTRLLDASTAQAILITAPAGYGKTTLAAEWVQGRENVVWYRATSGSADVAAFSVGLADVVAPLVPGASDRLKLRLRVADAPERAARPLAEILSEDLKGWPKGGLLIIDDYQLVADSAPVEEFMDWLLILTPVVRVLVTTRRRPTWASARRILYGEITEVDRRQLAMTTDEAALVLAGRSTKDVHTLVDQAEGWPALIGLAALSATQEIPTERLADALYRYFAEEVLRGEPKNVVRFLLIASVPPEIDRAATEELLGTEQAREILGHLIEEGLVERTGETHRFHPLLRSFLLQFLLDTEAELYEEAVEVCLLSALSHERWEQAFDIAVDTGRNEVITEILERGTPELLATGRIERLSRWLDEAAALGVDHPVATLARVELLIREGRLSEALPLARAFANGLPASNSHASRSWYLAGLVAHLISQEDAALDAHLRARQLASGRKEESDALWGAHIAALELERAEAFHYLAELEALQLSDSETRLRVATGRMGAAMAAAQVIGVIAEVNPLTALAERASDPMVATSFLTRIAELQRTRARYEEALMLAARSLAIAEGLHLDFAIGYCLVQTANAEIALRRSEAARQSLKRLAQITISHEDPYLDVALQVMHMKMKLADRRHRVTNADFPEQVWRRAPVALRAEYLSLKALTAVANSEPDKALSLALESKEQSEASDSRFSAEFAAVIASQIKGGDEDAFNASVAALTLTCAERDVLDPLVLAARSDYRVATAARASPAARLIFRDTLLRSKDDAIARSAGLIDDELEVALTNRVDRVLTPREREVLELISQGLSNSAIGEKLVITESTVKVHVHHILKKLGVATRLQAVLKYAGATESD